jgi:hypothetical protein
VPTISEPPTKVQVVWAKLVTGTPTSQPTSVPTSVENRRLDQKIKPLAKLDDTVRYFDDYGYIIASDNRESDDTTVRLLGKGGKAKGSKGKSCKAYSGKGGKSGGGGKGGKGTKSCKASSGKGGKSGGGGKGGKGSSG